MISYFKHYLVSLSYLLFVKNHSVGAILLILSFVRPSSGILSIVAYTASVLFGRYIGLKKNDIIDGTFTYNSALIGIGMGFLFAVSPLSISLTIIASIFTLLLSYALHQIFSYYLRLPILNFPFTVVIMLIYLASVRYGNLYIARNEFTSVLNLDFLPIWISGLFKATGIIVFLPFDIIGLMILLVIFFYSRINFFLTITGYYCGALFLWILKGSAYYAFTDVYGFNFILISLALGGLFMIPSIKSYVTALIGVLVSVFILDAVNVFWSSYSIPVFTMPFLITTLPVLYVMITSGSSLITKTFLGSPEKNLEIYLNYSARFNLLLPQPSLPFSGEWKVYQGFNGEWTHKGSWAYGIDFVIENKTDKLTYKNKGDDLFDYYCFNKPVLSPVSGIVIDACDDYKDNPVAVIDEQNVWGNYIIIQSPWLYYVEISHFAEKSLSVKTGDRVFAGQMIGKCGNSGYSPQPHIHMQIQHFPKPGAPSVPFRFIDTICEGTYIGGHRMPEKDQLVKPLTPSRSIERKMQLLLDESFSFDFFKDGTLIKNIHVKVKMAEDATYYLTEGEDDARLYFSCTNGIFSFYQYIGGQNSPLRFLLIALPRLPLTDEPIGWTDQLSSLLFVKGGSFFSFLRSFNHNMFAAEGNYCFTDSGEVKGSISANLIFGKKTLETNLTFHNYRLFSNVSVTMNGHLYVLTRKEG